jgi:hypothetical protein
MHSNASAIILEGCSNDIRLPIPDVEGLYYLNPDRLNELTDAIHLVIACIVADITNAGSERDTVLEDETLHNAIRNQLKEWTDV